MQMYYPEMRESQGDSMQMNGSCQAFHDAAELQEIRSNGSRKGKTNEAMSKVASPLRD